MKTYAFIDSQNLNLGTSKDIFQMYRRLKSYGYELIFKPTVKDNRGDQKGNVDAESSLLKKFQKYKIFLYREKQKLEFKP